ncbi:MAG TPA: PqqD family protein [Candidatus Methylomirabilis sp.]|nr:PqqD family protein [Candidatus Methylomirabilis sp.]
MNDVKPTRRDDVLVKDIGGEKLVHGGPDDAIHVLNPAAALIWDCCDGNHGVDEIAQLLRDHFSVPAERDVLGDVRSTLALLTSKGLLKPSA